MAASIVVTGGAGFIGSNLIQALNKQGHDDILVVDCLEKDEKWKNLVGLAYDDYLEADAFRERIKSGKLDGIETVYHLGACSSTSEQDARYLADNNYAYSRELCEVCLSNEARFVYASSGATYGDGSLGYSDSDTVTPTLRPLNMYGYSKHMFDLWALRRGLLDQIAGLKYFNVYGPREDHKGEMRSVVQKAYHQVKQDGFVRLFKSYHPRYADGEQVRDFVYVRDAVNVTLFLGEPDAPSGLFNCGFGEARTWNDLAMAVFAAMDKQLVIEYIEMPAKLQGKYQYRTQALMGKLKSAGYTEPFTTLEDGIHDYIQSYLEKQD